MTQVGEGREADEAAPVLTYGAPTVGEILAERYQLAEHINDDSAGRQVWRGVDVILRRPVAVVLRYPGGESAQEMLQAAVTASRVIHPNLAGVYDAIDEADRAYVVREWVDGEALREIIIGEGPLDAERATTIAHCVASAVAAVHATGMVHGNVHPGTVLVADDGRVVLADARATDGDTTETDVRAIGGVLYFALTGHWPHAEAAPSSLPDAVRDGSGAIAAPRQVRAGIPAYLDDLTMDLLDRRLESPPADVLAAELDRLDVAADDQFLDEEVGPLRFTTEEEVVEARPAATRRKVAVGVAGLLAVATAGLLLGISVLSDDDNGTDSPPNNVGAGVTAPASPGASQQPAASKPTPVALKPDQVRIVDPDGDRTELTGAEALVDGSRDTAWESDSYFNPPFGGKSGMGILIRLLEPREVTSVRVYLNGTGASAKLLTGQGDNANTKAGDQKIVREYKNQIGAALDKHDSPTLTMGGFPPEEKYQYLLVWFTDLPTTPDGKLRLEVQEIVVESK